MEQDQPKAPESPFYGPVYPREFDKCPVCGCKTRFCLEAMRGDLSTKELKEKNPALGAFEHIYETATHIVTIRCIVDSCVGCGAMITIARDKIVQPKPPDLTVPGFKVPPGRFPPGPGRFSPRPPFMGRG